MKILYSKRSNHSLAAMNATNTNNMKALSLEIKNKERIANNITPVMIRWFLFSSLIGSTPDTSLSTGSSTTPGQNVPSSSEEKKNLNFE